MRGNLDVLSRVGCVMPEVRISRSVCYPNSDHLGFVGDDKTTVAGKAVKSSIAKGVSARTVILPTPDGAISAD